MTALDAAIAGSASVAEALVKRGALAEAGALYARRFAGPACLIADENTWAAAGAGVEASLAAAGVRARRHVLPAAPRPKPTVALGRALADMLGPDETPVAIGSGVLNDVVKYAAFARGRRYLCVATAASMDGYTSAGAPLSDRGFKKTIQCRPARALLADLDVIAAAPRAMSGWGYGDLAGKVPAGADWLIADALGIEPLDAVAWPMVQDPLRGWLSRPEAVARGAPDAVADLFAGLAMVGLAMEAHGSSRPASGADHQIAHLWEMEDLTHLGARVSHGACVAVGCVAALALCDWLLAQDLSRLDPDRIAAAAPDMAAKTAAIRAAFGAGEIAARAEAETGRKHIDRPALAARLRRLRAVWPTLAARLRAQTIPAPAMRAMLRAAGAPADAGDIGVDPARLRRTVAAARFIRDRYTVLDLLDDAGLLAPAIAAAFDRAPAKGAP